MKKQTTGVYLLKDNKILFLVRTKKDDAIHKQGMYLPIGGHVELGEGLEACAIREVQEEAGITVHSVDLRGILYIRSQNTGDYDLIIFIYTSTDFEGEPNSGREGHFEWVALDKLKQANLYQGDKIFLDLMLKDKFFIVEFVYKGFELLTHTIVKLF